MNITLSYFSGICSSFIDKDRKEREVDRVIMFLRIIESEDRELGKRLNLLSGCSYFRSCYNKDCTFSLASRQSFLEKMPEKAQ